MPGPPTDVSAKDTFLILSTPKPGEEFDFPRKDHKGRPVARIRIQVLSMKEHEQARVEAHRKLKTKYLLKEEDMNGITMREVHGDAVAREVLATACRRTEPIEGTENSERGVQYPRAFRDAEQINDELTSNEILTLFHAYLLVQEKYAPFETQQENAEDVNRWIQRLEEGGDALPLLSLSLPQLARLTFSLAERTSSLYRALSTQWENLPDTLRSTLLTSFGDISSFGKPAGDPENTGLENSEPELRAGHDLTIEDAKDLARKLVPR
ncbi:hypothetical protein [Caudoviricetes sp.]|nr:hypothetical protein [Caudoviricetes sp.]